MKSAVFTAYTVHVFCVWLVVGLEQKKKKKKKTRDWSTLDEHELCDDRYTPMYLACFSVISIEFFFSFKKNKKTVIFV